MKRFLAKARGLLRNKELDGEMAEEMQFHLEERAAEEMEDGLGAEEARYAARRRFGGVEQIKERAREERGWVWLDEARRDLRFAARALRKSRGFTVVALLTLTLGIGVNTTAFSVLNTLLLHRLPYPQPRELVRVYGTSPDAPGGVAAYHAPANFFDHREQNKVFSQLAAWQTAGFNLSEGGQPADRLMGLQVSEDFFPMLGLPPELGRTFTPEECRPGNDAVVMLSHGMWMQRFGGDREIAGRKVRINGEPMTIVGVMPAAVDDYLLWGDVAMWRPLALVDATRADRSNSSLAVAGRLKPGQSIGQAQTEMTTIASRLAKTYPQFNAQAGLRLTSLARSIQDDTGRGITWMVTGLAGFVLLIACANLANLQFARNAAREREYAIRAALGASRGQLLRHVLTECLLLSLVGGGLALGFALWTNDLVGHYFMWGDHRGLDVALDGRVLVFTLVVSFLTGIGFGALPSWLAARATVNDALKPGSRGSTAGRAQNRMRHALIVAEVALALVLLTGAGFFLRGLQRFTQREAGWHTEGLLTAYVNLRGTNYATQEARELFYRRLQERLATLPRVEQAAIGSSLPTWGFNNDNSFVVEGLPEPAPNRGPSGAAADVTPGYFATLGIRLLQGRDFTANDTPDKPAVVVINESMARKFWPGESPVGKRIGGAVPFMKTPREIIGVVSDARPVAALGLQEGRFQMYRPLAQRTPGFATLALRSRAAPEAMAPELRRLVAGIDPDVAVYGASTVRREAERGVASVAVAAWTLVAFAALGVLLAAVGIYGVIANTVAQRTNEIGIRMALGAQVRDVFRLILGGGLRLTLIGVGIGLVGSYAVAQLLGAISPEFAATEHRLTALVTVMLVSVAAAACWLPARRAMTVDPMVALRAE